MEWWAGSPHQIRDGGLSGKAEDCKSSTRERIVGSIPTHPSNDNYLDNGF